MGGWENVGGPRMFKTWDDNMTGDLRIPCGEGKNGIEVAILVCVGAKG